MGRAAIVALTGGLVLGCGELPPPASHLGDTTATTRTTTLPGTGGGAPWTEITVDVGGQADPGPGPWPTGQPTGQPTGDPTDPEEPPPAPLPLRLTEVMADPEGRDGGPTSPEWIELVHPGDRPGDRPLALASLRLRARSWPLLTASELGLTDVLLEPGQVLVVERYDAAQDVPDPQRTEAAVFVGFHGGSGLRNEDGAVRIEDEGGTGFDLVIYGTPQPTPFDAPQEWAGPPVAVPGPNRSLCRPDPDMDNDNATDWSSCPLTPGTSEVPEPPPPLQPEAIAIVEVLANPPGPAAEETSAEYVELLNVGEEAVDLAGAVVADAADRDAGGTDTIRHRAGDGGCSPKTCLAPGRRALVVGNAYVGPTGEALVLETDDSTLADGGLTSVEPVVIRNRAGVLVSSYRLWDDPKAEPYPYTDERAVVRIDPHAQDVPEGWAFAEPSPGMP